MHEETCETDLHEFFFAQHVLPSLPGHSQGLRPWFDYKQLPLKAHLPVGVLFDLLVTDDGSLPWELTVCWCTNFLYLQPQQISPDSLHGHPGAAYRLEQRPEHAHAVLPCAEGEELSMLHVLLPP